MKIETITYSLPEHWASALINDDATGLSESEHCELLDWLEYYKPGFCVNVSDSHFFTENHDARDFGVLACDCLEFTFQVQ